MLIVILRGVPRGKGDLHRNRPMQSHACSLDDAQQRASLEGGKGHEPAHQKEVEGSTSGKDEKVKEET